MPLQDAKEMHDEELKDYSRVVEELEGHRKMMYKVDMNRGQHYIEDLRC